MTEIQLDKLLNQEFEPLYIRYAARIDCLGLPQKEMLELLQDCGSFSNPLLTLQSCGAIKWTHADYGAHEVELSGARYFYIRVCQGDRVRFTCWFSTRNSGTQSPRTKPLLQVEESPGTDR